MKKRNELSMAHWIVKSNVLNEMRNSRLTISHSRLLAIYLSKINPLDVNSREVTFKLDEYAEIMDFRRTNITQIKNTVDELLRVSIVCTRDTADYDKKTGLRGFESVSCLLFSKFKLYKNNNEEWLVNIDCHDDVVPLMFELKKHFFKYQLWNTLQLASFNQQRMYEILKQYERAGAREITVKDLREFLGLKKNEYLEWDNFRRRILEPAQEALAQNTDIKFTWEISSRQGKGGKISALKFNIEKNEDYIQPITIFDEYEQKGGPVAAYIHDLEEFERENDVVSFLSEACNDEFSREEVEVLHGMVVDALSIRGRINDYKIDMYDYLHRKYTELNMRGNKRNIKHRFAYMKKLIEVDAGKK